MMQADTHQRKRLRKYYRNLRNALTDRQQQWAKRAVVEQLLSMPEWENAKHIGVYLSNDGEIDLSEFCSVCWQHNKQLYLPVIHPFNPQYLLFLGFSATTKLTFNRFGIAEPVLECQQVLPISQLDLCVTPLVAFDKKGNRLGMGGGFYDRTFAAQRLRNRPLMLGVAHDCQQAESLPTQSWDIPLATIVTPEHIYRFSS